MDVTQFLAAYGIDAANLSTSQKDGVGQVLKAGGTAAIQELIRILSVKSSQYTTPTTSPTAAEQQQAAQDALDAANQAEADRLSKRRSRILIGCVAGGLLLLTVGLFWLTRKHRPHANTQHV